MPGFLTPKTYYCRKQSKFHKVHKKAFFNSKNIVIKDSQMGGLLCFFSIKSITYSNEDETQEKKKTLFEKKNGLPSNPNQKNYQKSIFYF